MWRSCCEGFLECTMSMMPSGARSSVPAQLQPFTFHAAFIQAQDIRDQRFHPFNHWTPSHSSIICQLGWKKVKNENEKVQDFKWMVQCVSVSILVMLLVSSLPPFKAQRKKAVLPDARFVTMEIFNNVTSSQWQPSVHHRLNEVHTLYTSEGYGKK